MSSRRPLSFLLLPLFAAWLLATADPVAASVVVPISDRALVLSSRAIAVVDVRSAQSGWDAGELYTYVEVQVHESISGPFAKGERLVLKQLGGADGETLSVVVGAPEFRRGERALVFLDTWPDGALRVAHLFLGKYDLVRAPHTGRLQAERKLDGHAVRLIGRASGPATDAADLGVFRQRIRHLAADAEVRAQAAVRWTGVPLLRRPIEYAATDHSGLDHLADSFELLQSSDGRFRRWFQPDRGQAVVFRPNPAGAPVADFRTRIDRALSTWTFAPLSNRIVNDVSPSQTATTNLVLQRGVDTTSAGLFTDGISAISFNDPRAQLSDPVNCGGIVAATQYRQFTNETRVIRGLTFNGLLESDVVFNNGFTSPGCGLLLDPVTVEEVTLHEVGHAIGFNHSQAISRLPGDDPAMRPTVFATGRGAKLAMDDLDAVSFLYPSGSNPVDEATFFVGQHYRDFLERQPDFSGWSFWTRNITDCPGCSVAQKRVDVARAFFFSQEFIDLEQSQDPSGRQRLAAANRNTHDYDEAFVDAAYRRYWKTSRPADDTWVAFLDRGIPGADYDAVIRAFVTDRRYTGRFVNCRAPLQEIGCGDQGGSWDAVSCSCHQGCNPFDEQTCYANGGVWNSVTCTCSPMSCTDFICPGF